MRAVRVGRDWRRFSAWAAVGACCALGVSVLGLLTIPVGVVLALWLTRNRSGIAAIGTLVGAGAVAVFVGSLHRGYQPCSSQRSTLVLPPGQQSISSSCGGVDGWHWIIVGTALMVLATVIYIQKTGGSLNSSATAGTPPSHSTPQGIWKLSPTSGELEADHQHLDPLFGVLADISCSDANLRTARGRQPTAPTPEPASPSPGNPAPCGRRDLNPQGLSPTGS